MAVLVKRMNQRLRVPDLSSALASEQPTEPAGYSPPMPMPTLGLGRIRMLVISDILLVKGFGDHYRTARSAALRKLGSWGMIPHSSARGDGSSQSQERAQ